MGKSRQRKRYGSVQSRAVHAFGKVIGEKEPAEAELWKRQGGNGDPSWNSIYRLLAMVGVRYQPLRRKRR